MGGRTDYNQFYDKYSKLLAADAVRQIADAPSGGAALLIELIEVYITVSAAQVILITDDTGAIVLGAIPASAPVGTQFRIGPYPRGRLLLPNVGVIIDPAAAGPAAEVYFSGYIVGPKAI